MPVRARPRARMQVSIVARERTTPRPSHSTNPPPVCASVAVTEPCRGATAGASVPSLSTLPPAAALPVRPRARMQASIDAVYGLD
eukprot:4590946-Prymnesium_polylepis.1